MGRSTASCWALRLGLILAILGMISGLVMVLTPEVLKNPRLALSSHMLGLMGGIFLLCIGFLVPRVRISPRALGIAMWLFFYGAYANWLGAVLGSVFGTGSMTPIAAPGYSADPWQETLVTIVIYTCGPATLIASIMFLCGIKREEPSSAANDTHPQ